MNRDTLETFAITYGLGVPIAAILWTLIPNIIIHAAAFVVISFGLGAIALFMTNVVYTFGCGVMIGWRFARDIMRLKTTDLATPTL